ncbi:MAG: EscU/YscU/HrcU family type III secretion system export apparatus switch protein [Clostridia bacterium]|nr:EscU/YscU/HrcU family type III secretion system export apparatus switch protein [Clostridia bacterium]
MSETNEKKIKKVAALKYLPGEDKAPKIVALGKGEIAEKIVETAKANNVPVYENAQLAHTLSSLSIGDDIPQELYEVVAEILVFVSNMDREYGGKNASGK